MKLRFTTPASPSFFVKAAIVVSVFVMALAVPIQLMSQAASADTFEERIRALEADISRYDAQASVLSQQADSLQREVSRIAGEKATIQAQVDISQAKFDQLTAKIAETEAKIKENQDGLGSTIADLYVDGNVSPIEMLASSENITDFLNKQEYRNSVRDQLSSTIKTVKDLKTQLSQQKTDVANVLKDQTAQKDLLQQKENEQQALLNKTAGDEANYRALSSQTLEQKKQVEREQKAAIDAAIRAAGGGGSKAVPGDPNHGGYPDRLANSDYYNAIVDPWGMYARQCVSYTAWKVYQKNGYMPYWGGHGNANQWPASAQAEGIAVGTTPRAGSVGVIMAGAYGHVVWVEGVNSNGTINISQYNYDFNGYYSEMYNVSPRSYNYYIYF